jgi:hypothetical protein
MKKLAFHGLWLSFISLPLLGIVWVIWNFFVPVMHHELIKSLFENYDSSIAYISGHRALAPYALLAIIRAVNPLWAPPYSLGHIVSISLSVFAAIVNVGLLFFLIRKTSKHITHSYAMMFCMSLLVFSFAQWENWTATSLFFF